MNTSFNDISPEAQTTNNSGEFVYKKVLSKAFEIFIC